MLDEPPMLTIRRNFERPSAAQLARLAGLPTGWVGDAQNGRAALGAGIKALFPGVPGLDQCHGTAVTCWCGPNDNLAITAALAIAQAGDVIVAATDGFTEAGHIGDLVAGMMRNKQLAGFVIDGAVRDILGLREVGLPVFAAAVTPDSCVRTGPGTVGLPITIGRRRIHSGDIVVADIDGVTTIPLTELDQVMERIEAVKAAEAGMLERVRGGLREPDFIGELMASKRVRFVD